MRATSDAVILLEALYSEEQVSVGLVTLSPPRRAGRVPSAYIALARGSPVWCLPVNGGSHHQ